MYFRQLLNGIVHRNFISFAIQMNNEFKCKHRKYRKYLNFFALDPSSISTVLQSLFFLWNWTLFQFDWITATYMKIIITVQQCWHAWYAIEWASEQTNWMGKKRMGLRRPSAQLVKDEYENELSFWFHSSYLISIVHR